MAGFNIAEKIVLLSLELNKGLLNNFINFINSKNMHENNKMANNQPYIKRYNCYQKFISS